jgi:hypothetical protein
VTWTPRRTWLREKSSIACSRRDGVELFDGAFRRRVGAVVAIDSTQR